MTSDSDTPIPEAADPGHDTSATPAEAAAPRPRRRKAPAAAAAAAEAAGQGDAPAAVEPAAAVSAQPSDAEPRHAHAAADSVGDEAFSHRDDDNGEGRSADGTRADGEARGEGVGEGDGEAGGEGGNSERSRRRNRRERRRNEDRGPARQALPLPPNFEGPLPLHLMPTPPPEAGEVFSQVISGEFDDTAEPPPDDDPAKRILAPERDAPKLHKVLAQAGIGSRRDMEDMILEGRITVNGEPAHTGQRVSFGDRVDVDGKPVRLRIVPPPSRIIAYHKPAGEIVTHDDPENRPTVFRRLPRLPQGKWQSVGRLDINTEGLLLFTNSGGLANQLMHPRFGVEREYAVRVMGTLDDEARARLLEGVEVDGQRAAFKSIERGGGEGLNQWYRVVITEGRNREVRKLFDTVGLTVSRLIRIRYGTIVLPHGLKRGVWVDLDENDMRSIRRLAGGAPQERGEARPEGGGNGSGNGNPNGKRRDDRNARPARAGERPPERGNDRGGNDRGNDRNRPAGPPRRDEARFEPPRQADDRPPQRDANGDGDDDFEIDPASIPNPLQQTFDHRFVQGRRIGPNSGFGAGGSAPRPTGGNDPRGGPKQPDPLQTSVGYIGADAYRNKARGNRNNRGGGGYGGGGQGGGGGGGGYGGGGGGNGGGQGGGGGGGYGGGGGGRRGR